MTNRDDEVGAGVEGARPVKRGRKGLATRATIVAAAREVFVRDGFLTARIVDICETAGVATGSFYNYFDDKDSVFAAVLEAAESEMLHQPRLSEQSSDGAPAATIRAANRAYFESYRDNASIMALLYQVSSINQEYRDVLRKRGEAFFKRNAKFIARLQAEGLADSRLDPYQAARALSSMVSRLAQGTYVLGEDTPLDTLVDTCTRLWINALGVPEEMPTPRSNGRRKPRATTRPPGPRAARSS